MAHYGENAGRGPRRVKNEWLALNSQIGDMANEWSSRRDLVAYIGDDGGRGMAPAIFDPIRAEIEVNVKVAFGEHVQPHQIGDFTQRKTHFEYPKAAGFTFHEASHAQFTTINGMEVYEQLKADKGGDAAEAWRILDTYKLLDESRIEGLGVRKLPKNKAFLRASALTLVQAENEEEEAQIAMQNPVTFAMRSMALCLARVDAGVLDKKDVVPIRKVVEKVVKLPFRKRARALWREFQSLNDRLDLPRMLEIAEEWNKLVREVMEDNGQDPDKEEQKQQQQREKGESGDGQPGGDSESGGDGEGEDGSGSGDLTEEQKELIEALKEALGQAAGESETEGAKEAHEQETVERNQAKQEAAKEAQKEKEGNQQIAAQIFDPNAKSSGRTNSRLMEKRDPTNEEKITANRISRDLEKARYRDRTAADKSMKLPPGALRVGVAMQGKAIRNNGGTDNTEPWHKTVRHHVEDPTITLGLMCDISGSMSHTMAGMATAAWVMSEAIRRIQGRTAAVYFGEDVFSVLKPGEHLKQVTRYSAEDGYEEFDKAFRALDGGLNLLQGTGPRIVVVCSDGQYRSDEIKATKKWLKRCKKEGIAVVWLGLDSGYGSAKDMCEATGHTHVDIPSGDVVAATAVIGSACEKALTEAGRTRNL